MIGRPASQQRCSRVDWRNRRSPVTSSPSQAGLAKALQSIGKAGIASHLQLDWGDPGSLFVSISQEGDGRVALILDVGSLVRRTRH